jgi:hypothetical protein
MIERERSTRVGDCFAIERSEWNPESLVEKRYDVEKNMRLFKETNAAAR